jgi:23S rRNA pseudouridine2605 synthase
LMHPSMNLEREYAVRVLGTVTPKIISNLLNGVKLEDGLVTKFNKLNFVGGAGANIWYNATLNQGRYREVRRLWESQGLSVSRLIRIRYGPLTLPRDLPEGKYLELDYAALKKQFKIDKLDMQSKKPKSGDRGVK